MATKVRTTRKPASTAVAPDPPMAPVTLGPFIESIYDVTRRVRLLDMALYGAVSLGEHSIPAEGWDAALTPLWFLASDIHRDLTKILEASEGFEGLRLVIPPSPVTGRP